MDLAFLAKPENLNQTTILALCSGKPFLVSEPLSPASPVTPLKTVVGAGGGAIPFPF